VILRPFFRYHGGKWRAVHAGLYPHPLHDTIIEPFAGSAGYSLHYADHRVILVERYHVVAEIWRWLIGAAPADVMAVPLVDDVDDLPAETPEGARYLVGFAMNAAVTSPRRRISRSALALRAAGRKLYGWSEALRERVAAQVEHIKHWILIEDDYTQAPDITATHYIDSPYQYAGGGLHPRPRRDRLPCSRDVVPRAPRSADRVRGADGDLAAVPLDRRGEVRAPLADGPRGGVAVIAPLPRGTR
jgi:hypothetical protein